jgi:hypothetical protein
VVLTIAAYYWFSPQFDVFSEKAQDAKALELMIRQMLSAFTYVWDGQGRTYPRLQLQSPVVPREDLLADCNQETMELLHKRLIELLEALTGADREPLPEKACRILASQFGAEFPTPSPEETAKRVRQPYISTGHSA